jgi:hypothetical protein
MSDGGEGRRNTGFNASLPPDEAQQRIERFRKDVTQRKENIEELLKNRSV